jgi:hypothetical protein
LPHPQSKSPTRIEERSVFTATEDGVLKQVARGKIGRIIQMEFTLE